MEYNRTKVAPKKHSKTIGKHNTMRLHGNTKTRLELDNKKPICVAGQVTQNEFQ